MLYIYFFVFLIFIDSYFKTYKMSNQEQIKVLNNFATEIINSVVFLFKNIWFLLISIIVFFYEINPEHTLWKNQFIGIIFLTIFISLTNSVIYYLSDIKSNFYIKLYSIIPLFILNLYALLSLNSEYLFLELFFYFYLGLLSVFIFYIYFSTFKHSFSDFFIGDGMGVLSGLPFVHNIIILFCLFSPVMYLNYNIINTLPASSELIQIIQFFNSSFGILSILFLIIIYPIFNLLLYLSLFFLNIFYFFTSKNPVKFLLFWFGIVMFIFISLLHIYLEVLKVKY